MDFSASDGSGARLMSLVLPRPADPMSQAVRVENYYERSMT